MVLQAQGVYFKKLHFLAFSDAHGVVLLPARVSNLRGLKKELRKRNLDSSYSGSKRELLQRLEKFVRDDNKKNALVVRGNWLGDVESAFQNL